MVLSGDCPCPFYLKDVMLLRDNAKVRYRKTGSIESFFEYSILHEAINHELKEISERRRNKKYSNVDWLLVYIGQQLNICRTYLNLYDVRRNDFYLKKFRGTSNAAKKLIIVHIEKNKPRKKTYSEVLQGY